MARELQTTQWGPFNVQIWDADTLVTWFYSDSPGRGPGLYRQVTAECIYYDGEYRLYMLACDADDFDDDAFRIVAEEGDNSGDIVGIVVDSLAEASRRAKEFILANATRGV